jgi:hypothetical protein
MQTGTASAGGICVMPCEQGRKREHGDNKPKSGHKRLHGQVAINGCAIRPLPALISVKGY